MTAASRQRVAALLALELTLLRRNRSVYIVLVVAPLLLAIFLGPLLRLALAQEGYASATGAEQVIPGLVVMFAFFVVGNVAFVFFREYGWKTWDRLRASPLTTGEIVVAKLVPMLVLALGQQAALFAAGAAFFGLPLRWAQVPLLAAIAVSLTLFLVGFGLLTVVLATNLRQVGVVENVGAMLFAGLGGALTPVALLPGWAQSLAPGTPTYWALRAYRAVLLPDRPDLGTVALSTGALCLAATVLFLIAVTRFDVGRKKVMWV
ncbi:ABC transporter permease [Actinosynnema sp. NPDC023587]|uniref:ABC transporter permease n=1 Tax=Actinosynnema sp. NPDC023587 TaxID=3154695 RepID=UPI0033F7915F